MLHDIISVEDLLWYTFLFFF